jgi:catechol 2,3-dioxygenase-like lactoylglutathione lyase family enzyme
MKRLGACFAFLPIIFLSTAVFCWAEAKPRGRPRITGIDHVEFYTTQRDGVQALYGGTLGLDSADPVEAGELARYRVGKQWVGFRGAPDASSPNRLDHVAFRTENVVGLRKYLREKGVQPEVIQTSADGTKSFLIDDPEGNRIEFVQRQRRDPKPGGALLLEVEPNSISSHMIHAGILVRSREAEDHFYRDLLGFRLYWHGGMKPEDTEWVAMQVPDGTDWLEYMLNQPEHPDRQTLGVMNHISLGVRDMKKTQAKLEARGWKPHGDEKAQMGRDGKWQLNLFDPEGTRIELMEFKPAEKPCCADFTGPHPSD